jgi:hypothetical protein
VVVVFFLADGPECVTLYAGLNDPSGARLLPTLSLTHVIILAPVENIHQCCWSSHSPPVTRRCSQASIMTFHNIGFILKIKLKNSPHP